MKLLDITKFISKGSLWALGGGVFGGIYREYNARKSSDYLTNRSSNTTYVEFSEQETPNPSDPYIREKKAMGIACTIANELDIKDEINIKSKSYKNSNYRHMEVLSSISSQKIHLFVDNVKSFDEDELEAVLAHELAHVFRSHEIKKEALEWSIISASMYAQIEVGARGLVYLLKKYGPDSQVQSPVKPMKVSKSLGIVSSILVLQYYFIPIITMAYSRYCEKEADVYASQKCGAKKGLIKFFERQKQINPDKEKSLYDTHPTTKERIEYLKNLNLEERNIHAGKRL